MSNMSKNRSSGYDYDLNNSAFQKPDQVSEKNKRAVSKFTDKLYAEDLTEERVKKCLSSFPTLLKMAEEGFYLLDTDKEDL